MRDERKKQARSNKQTRQSNTAHRGSHFSHVHVDLILIRDIDVVVTSSANYCACYVVYVVWWCGC